MPAVDRDPGRALAHAAAQARRQRGLLLGGHDVEAELDLLDSVEGEERLLDLLLEARAERAAGDGERDHDADAAAFDGDVAHHVELDHGAPQLGVVDALEGAQDLLARGHGPRLAAAPCKIVAVDGRILLVEDDASIRETTSLGLERAGFEVTTAADGNAALERFRREPFDLLVLDLMLPGPDGYEICREVRKASRVPIVMLSARSDTVDVVVGLELGADDYVTKPFELPELVARIRAALRRASAGDAEERLAAGDLELDPEGFRARKAGEELDLTATEFRLLLVLAQSPGRVFTRELLLERVWNYEYLGDSRLVDVAVQRLRAKVEDDPANPRLITTVRGVGYRFDKP